MLRWCSRVDVGGVEYEVDNAGLGVLHGILHNDHCQCCIGGLRVHRYKLNRRLVVHHGLRRRLIVVHHLLLRIVDRWKSLLRNLLLRHLLPMGLSLRKLLLRKLRLGDQCLARMIMAGVILLAANITIQTIHSDDRVNR